MRSRCHRRRPARGSRCGRQTGASVITSHPLTAKRTSRRKSPSGPPRNVRFAAKLISRNDADRLAAASFAELHGAGGRREQRVVPATPHVDPGVEGGATLANQDLARLDDLTAEPLHAKPLRGGVAAVAGARRALLVCHLLIAP